MKSIQTREQTFPGFYKKFVSYASGILIFKKSSCKINNRIWKILAKTKYYKYYMKKEVQQ